VTVHLYDGEKLLGEKTIDLIDAPIDFKAKRQNVQFNQMAFSGNLKIIIDPEINSVKYSKTTINLCV
jgi:hypothetical protein